MFSLEIIGFRSQAEVEEFIQWYEGQGEQDACTWFECRKQEGKIDRNFIPVDCQKTYPIKFHRQNGTKAIMFVAR